MSETVTANDGTLLPLISLNQAFTYDGSGNVLTATVQYPAKLTGILTTYVQTFTNVGGNVTNISEWVAT